MLVINRSRCLLTLRLTATAFEVLLITTSSPTTWPHTRWPSWKSLFQVRHFLNSSDEQPEWQLAASWSAPCFFTLSKPDLPVCHSTDIIYKGAKVAEWHVKVDTMKVNPFCKYGLEKSAPWPSAAVIWRVCVEFTWLLVGYFVFLPLP